MEKNSLSGGDWTIPTNKDEGGGKRNTKEINLKAFEGVNHAITPEITPLIRSVMQINHHLVENHPRMVEFQHY
jgi:hypothetical protein